jgi:hypothetical protein
MYRQLKSEAEERRRLNRARDELETQRRKEERDARLRRKIADVQALPPSRVEDLDQQLAKLKASSPGVERNKPADVELLSSPEYLEVERELRRLTEHPGENEDKKHY